MFGNRPKKPASKEFTLDDFRDQIEKLQKAGLHDQMIQTPGMAAMIPEGEDPEVALKK